MLKDEIIKISKQKPFRVCFIFAGRDGRSEILMPYSKMKFWGGLDKFVA